jgi:glycosyltransferase involved in cell wall biosynthesis
MAELDIDTTLSRERPLDLCVVIPVFNKERTVNRAALSVLNQIPPVSQVIIVDDGSSDNWFDVLDERVSSDVRVQILRQKNQGVSVARNAGAELACADYVAFLDADDYWLPGFCFRIRELISEYPNAGFFCVGRVNVFDGEGEWVPRTGFPKGFSGIVEHFFYQYSKASFVHTSATVIKRKDFQESAGFPVGALVSQDVHLWIKLGKRSVCVFDDEPLSVRTREPDNSRFRRVGKIPYPIQYFSQNPAEYKEDGEVFLFFQKFCIRQILAAKISGDLKGAYNRYASCYTVSLYVALFGLAAVCAPRIILKALKKKVR